MSLTLFAPVGAQVPSHIRLQTLQAEDDSVTQLFESLSPQYTPYADGVGFGFRFEIVASSEMPEQLRLLFGALIAAKHAELRSLVSGVAPATDR